MVPKLTAEQREALRQAAGGAVLVEGETSMESYFLVDRRTHEAAMQALRREADRAAIQRGLDDMQAGRGLPAEAADELLRRRLGFPPRTDR